MILKTRRRREPGEAERKLPFVVSSKMKSQTEEEKKKTSQKKPCALAVEQSFEYSWNQKMSLGFHSINNKSRKNFLKARFFRWEALFKEELKPRAVPKLIFSRSLSGSISVSDSPWENVISKGGCPASANEVDIRLMRIMLPFMLASYLGILIIPNFRVCVPRAQFRCCKSKCDSSSSSIFVRLFSAVASFEIYVIRWIHLF